MLDNAMIGTLNPEVRGTIKSGRSPTNSVWPEPVATRAHGQDDREGGHDAEGCVGQGRRNCLYHSMVINAR